MTRILERTARYFAVGAHEGYLLTQWVTTVMIAVHWGLGVAILVGGPGRFSLPTYQPLIDLAGGQTWLWGLHICLSALLMMIPLRWPNILGLWLGMIWMIMWTALFAMSVVQYPTSAATPAVAYAGFAMIDAALLTVRVIEKPLPAKRG